MLLAAVTLGLSACASYDHKDYPRESWFAPSTQVISADQFKKVETPLKVALVVNYTWEGRPIVSKRFTFSYFNNMDFHTEFVRRFYKQMIFEGVQQIENELQ